MIMTTMVSLLAETCAKSGLMAELTGSTGRVDMNTAANVVRAVIGAFVGEKAGDFYSVVQMWQWLTQSSMCQTTLRFLDHAPTKFKGRTPTYKTFKQVKVDGALELHVDFEDHQVVRFCRPAMDGNQSAHLLGSFLLQEDVTEVKHAWRSVQSKSPVCLVELGERQTAVRIIFRQPFGNFELYM